MATTPLQSATKKLAGSSAAVDALVASVKKLLEDADSERFRKISLTSPHFKAVATAPGGMEFMRATGWTQHYGHLLLNRYDRQTLESALGALKVSQGSAEYREDKARCRLARAEAHALAERAREAASLRAEFASKVPEEPPDGAAGSARVCIHLSDGAAASAERRVWRRFEAWNTVQDLANFVRSLPNAPKQLSALENLTARPALRLDLEAHRGHTLQSCDLWPCAHVRVIESMA